MGFHSIPSPKISGLWEASVKPFKCHLKKIVRNLLLVLIEACLHSHPLTQMSNDPVDLEPITPRHILIGHPLIAPTEPDLQLIFESRLSN
jgi:hypothetical protein